MSIRQKLLPLSWKVVLLIQAGVVPLQPIQSFYLLSHSACLFFITCIRSRPSGLISP